MPPYGDELRTSSKLSCFLKLPRRKREDWRRGVVKVVRCFGMKKLRVEGFDLSQRWLREWNQTLRRGRKAADPRGEGGGPQDIVCGGETVERRQIAGVVARR